METLRKVIRFYVEGFREMTVGRTLWAIILIKLFILFAVLKVFFFPDLLAGKSPSEKAGCVLEPDTRNSATMNAPVIMQFRPPLAASIPLRGRVAGAVRARKRGRKPQTRRLRRPGATQTTNQ